MMAKKPQSKDRDVYIRFFPTDWRGDEGLSLCSLAARGLWIELLCLAHRHGGYVLVAAGRVPTDKELAKQCRCSQAALRRGLDELRHHEVCHFDEASKALYSKRMVRDEKRRQVNRENGRNGGNPTLSVNRLYENRITDSDKPHSPESRSIVPEDQDPTTALMFPTDGSKAFYLLTHRQVSDWKALYPALDVLGECRRALAWIHANPTKRKTSAGMPKFLVAWLNRTQEKQSTQTVQPIRPRTLGPMRVLEPWESECGELHGFECAGPQMHAERMASKAASA